MSHSVCIFFVLENLTTGESNVTQRLETRAAEEEG
jgi:hypothetical protein